VCAVALWERYAHAREAGAGVVGVVGVEEDEEDDEDEPNNTSVSEQVTVLLSCHASLGEALQSDPDRRTAAFQGKEIEFGD